MRAACLRRAAKTLLVYLQETNPTVYHWLFVYLKQYPIPTTGTWDEVSGEVFLRRMLQSPLETAKFNLVRIGKVLVSVWLCTEQHDFICEV